MTVLKASVVIPTFNGAARLPLVFDALADQTAPAGTFEVVVVDNASTDDTAQVAKEHPAVARLTARGFPCSVVREPRQGSTHARIAGLSAAGSELVCFLDDDNLPDPDYLKNGVKLFSEQTIGLAVSSVRPRWEGAPPSSVLRRQHLLAVNQYMGSKLTEFDRLAFIAPTITAGLWVRRNAFLAAIPCDQPERLLPDRVGNSLACGGDLEFGILIGNAGYRRVYAPALRVVHLIPARRLTVSYVCRLISGIVRSELTLREKYCGQTYRAFDRLKALGGMFAAVLGMPAIALFRADGVREVVFIAADRWARVKGPLRRFA
jgi:glycosyltransferase involved in cell wall biosynthesis